MTAKKEFRHDRATRKDVKVEETADFWIISDSVASRPGVFNRALRPAEDLARSHAWMDNNPVGLLHPPDDAVHHGLLYVYPDERHGFVSNVRLGKDGEILFDSFLFKRPDVPGYQTTQAIVDANARIVARIRAGEPIDVSPGYMTRVERAMGEHGGKAYDEVRRDFAWTHVAIVPQGACGWGDGCGLGRAQDANQGDTDMSNGNGNPNPGGAAATVAVDAAELRELREKAAKVDSLSTQVADLQKTTKNATDSLARLDAIEADMKKERDARAEADKKRLDGKRDELARLRGIVAADGKVVDQAARAALDGYCEAALDDSIRREKVLAQARSGRADGLALAGGGSPSSPTFGPTVGAWDEKKHDWATPKAQ